MVTRRSVLAAGAVGVCTLSAGCLDFALGNDALSFHAEPVLPTEEALADTGFERQENERHTIDETVEFGVEREISASIWTGVHSKTTELRGSQQEAATFVSVSMPSMEVLGSSYNPLADLDGEELLEELDGELDGEGVGDLRDVRYEETIELRILGDDRAVDRFSAESDLDGEAIEIVVSLTSFDHDDDRLVLLGVHPELLPDLGADIELLMESVEHPA